MTELASSHTRHPKELEEDNHWWFASSTCALLALMDPILPGRDLKVLDIGSGRSNMITIR